MTVRPVKVKKLDAGMYELAVGPDVYRIEHWYTDNSLNSKIHGPQWIVTKHPFKRIASAHSFKMAKAKLTVYLRTAESKLEAWQTDRLYTDAGQRMAATYDKDGHVLFVDIDRGIDGRSKEPVPEATRGAVSLRQVAMHVYDYNLYDGFRWQEGYDNITKELIAAAQAVPWTKR